MWISGRVSSSRSSSAAAQALGCAFGLVVDVDVLDPTETHATVVMPASSETDEDTCTEDQKAKR